MKAIGVEHFGGPDTLQVVERELPQPGHGDVRVRVLAVPVNPTDATFRSGGRKAELEDQDPPYIPGMDFAGVVDALGEDTTGRLRVGESVVGFAVPFGERGGSYAEYIVLPEASVVASPERVTPAEASTLLLNAVTAFTALEALGSIGGPVLVTGAAGAVGGCVLQIARTRGLESIALADETDRDLVFHLGATHFIRRADDLGRAVRAVVAGGVSWAIDAASLNESIVPALSDKAHVVTLRGWKPLHDDTQMSVTPVRASASATDTSLFTELVEMVERGQLELRVAEVLPGDQASLAHHRLAQGGLRGKLVLDLATLSAE